jgi:autotransporter-associated beta strand protein
MSVGVDVKVRWAAFIVAAGLFGASASATSYTWQGDGDDATGPGAPAPDATEVTAGEQSFKLWTAANNWDPEAVPGSADSVTFGPPTLTGAVNVAYNTPISVSSIQVNQALLGGNSVGYEIEAYDAGKLTLVPGGSITLGDNTPGIAFRGPIDLQGSASFNGGALASSYNFSAATVTGLAAGSTLSLNTGSGTANAIGVVTGPINLVRGGTGGSLSFFGQMTYTGSTTIVSFGTATNQNLVKADNVFPSTTILTLASSTLNGIIRIDDDKSITLGGLQVAAGAPGASTANGIITSTTSANAISTLTIDATQFTSFSGRLGATGAASQKLNLVKKGPAAFTMSTSANTYTGATSVLGGTLEVESGNINGTSGITINGGRLMYGSSTALTKPVTLTDGTIGGAGSIGTAVTVGAGGTISPGGNVDAAGVLTETVANQNYTAGLTFAPSGSYRYDTDASTGDLLTVSGGTGLAIAATAGSPFVIDVHGQGLTAGTGYTRTLVTSSTGVTLFDPAKFSVSGEATSASVSQVGNDLVLNFTALQNIYWDINGSAGAGAGGATPAGNWNGTDANFNTDSTGGAGGSTMGATTAFHIVNFGAGSDATGNYTVTLSNTQSAAAVNVDEGNVTLTGGTLATGAFRVAAGASATIASLVTGGTSNSIVKSGLGTLTLTNATTHTGGTTVTAGTLILGNADATAGGTINIADGALAQAQAGLPKAVTVSTLSTNTGGKLDLTDNSMVVKGMTAPQVQALLQSGYNAGHWDGATGITSSTAAASTEASIGYASNASLNLTQFKDVTGLTTNDVLVKYTYAGDANLDGKVDIGDLGLLAGAWQQSGKVWFDGDFTYNGTVDIGDLGLIAGNWQKGVGSGQLLVSFDEALAQFSAFEGVVVPEPASLMLLGVGGLALGGRRRRVRSN